MTPREVTENISDIDSKMDGTVVEDEEGGRPSTSNNAAVEEKSQAKTKAEKARERKARSRAKLKEQGNFEEAEKNRKRMAELRKIEKAEKKPTMKKGRKSYEDEKEADKLYKRKIRANMTSEEKEFRKIENVIAVRKHRESRDGKQRLLDRMWARRGMEYERIKPFESRKSRDKDENKLWKQYCQESPDQKTLFETLKPDTAEKFKKEEEEEKEKRKLQDEKKKEEEDEMHRNGYWQYMADCDDYMWVGSGPAPDPACEFIDPIYDDPYDVSEEQKKHEKEHEELCLEWALKERRRKNAESVKRHREKIKAELLVPIEMPDYELSEYELIRQKNIEEIEKFKKSCGLFNN